jgi:hypothetical protein
LNIVIISLYKIIGNIDFHTLIFIGNSSFLALLWLVWKYENSVFPAENNRLAYFIPVALLVLSPAYFEASLWATGVLQNLPVFVFAFLAISCTAQRPYFFFTASLLAGLLAIGATANGMVVLLACSLVLGLQRRFTHASLMAFLFIAVAWFYTRGFPLDASIPLTTSLSDLMSFFLALCGATVWGKNGAILLGALLVAGFGALTWYGLPKRNPVLWGFGFFLLLSMAMMTLGRAGLGLEAALVSRYKPYSGLMLVVVYMGSLTLVSAMAWKKVIGFSGLVISGVSFVSYLIHYDAAITDFGFRPKLELAYRSIEGKMPVLVSFPEVDFANHVIDTAVRYAAYRPPSFSEFVLKPAFFTDSPALPTPLPKNSEGANIHISHFIDGKKAVLVYGVILGECSSKPFSLVLKNEAKSLHFSPQAPDMGWLNINFGLPRTRFFGGIVDKRLLPLGIYKLGGACGNKEAKIFENTYQVYKNP